MSAVIAFAIGVSVGSFVNVVADRLPHGKSLVSPRSYCSSCNRPLSNIELVPIFSYLWLRGRCRHCGAPIPVRVIVVEVTTGLLFTAVYLRFDFGFDFVVLAAAVSLLLAVAIIDLEHKLILNRIVFPSLVIILIVAPFWPSLGLPRTFPAGSEMLASLANSLVAGIGAFLLFLTIYVAYPNGMGGGDVKLAGLIGLLVGFPGLIVALWGGIVSGGLVAIVLLVLRRKGRKDEISFGSFLSAAAIVVLLWGSDIISGYNAVAERITGL